MSKRKTLKQIQTSAAAFCGSKRLSDDIKAEIKSIYRDDRLRNMKDGPHIMWKRLCSIHINDCTICGSKIFLTSSCPGILSNNTLPDNPTQQQLVHYKSYCDAVKKGAQNRDNSYLVERNKSDFMRAVSSRTGKINGPKNLKAAHEKFDRYISCDECEDLECKVRNIKDKNFQLMGAGCLTKHNNTDVMKKSSGERIRKFDATEKGKANTQNQLKKLNSIVKQFCDKCGTTTAHDGFGNCLHCKPRCSAPNFIEKNEILHYLDKRKVFVPWEEYKKAFKVKESAQDCNLPDGFELYPTFRTQDSKDWSNASQAFDRSLVEANIGWFVYIKFYVDKNNDGELVRRPLVVGKTGSKLVNKSGTDVCFSTDISDGPARRFLSEENLEWDKTVIAICKCESELEAYQLEMNIANTFGLFES